MPSNERFFEPNTLDFDSLKHYTNIKKFKKIIAGRTWKLSNILSMNDRKEIIRIGANEETFSHYYLTCFSNSLKENHAMWHIYGKDNRITRLKEKKNKIIIELSKDTFFSHDNFKEEYLHYCGKGIKSGKCFYDKESEEDSYESVHLVSKELIKIEYLENEDDVFQRNYLITGDNNKPEDGYTISVGTFGKQKTDTWKYEEEVRILVATLREPKQLFCETFLLLRLNEEFFRGMKIILSPWDDGKSKRKIKKLIKDSGFSQDIQNSIRIEESIETGMFE